MKQCGLLILQILLGPFLNTWSHIYLDHNTFDFFYIYITFQLKKKKKDIIKIVKSLEDSGLLLKGVTETVQNEVK